MSGSRAHQLMDAVVIVNNLRNSTKVEVPHLPKTETAVRPLVGLSAEDQTEVWTEACKEANGHPTAEQVKKTVARLVPPET